MCRLPHQGGVCSRGGVQGAKQRQRQREEQGWTSSERTRRLRAVAPGLGACAQLPPCAVLPPVPYRRRTSRTWTPPPPAPAPRGPWASTTRRARSSSPSAVSRRASFIFVLLLLFLHATIIASPGWLSHTGQRARTAGAGAQAQRWRSASPPLARRCPGQLPALPTFPAHFPAWFSPLIHCFAGTSDLNDAMTDAAASAVPYCGGYAHLGMLKAVRPAPHRRRRRAAPCCTLLPCTCWLCYCQ